MKWKRFWKSDVERVNYDIRLDEKTILLSMINEFWNMTWVKCKCCIKSLTDNKKKRLKLIAIKLNVILYWLLLQKTSTVHRKNEFFMFKKR